MQKRFLNNFFPRRILPEMQDKRYIRPGYCRKKIISVPDIAGNDYFRAGYRRKRLFPRRKYQKNSISAPDIAGNTTKTVFPARISPDIRKIAREKERSKEKENIYNI